MKKIIRVLFVFQTIVISGFAMAASNPCQQIKQACLSAGFIQGEVQEGKGLWRDCVDPVIQGIAKAGNAVLPLPVVDPKIVAACKQKNPKFGSGKVGM